MNNGRLSAGFFANPIFETHSGIIRRQNAAAPCAAQAVDNVPARRVGIAAPENMMRRAPWAGKNGKPVRISVAVSDAPFLNTLRQFLVRLPEVELVGEAAHGLAALCLVGELHPDLALLEFYLPGIDGCQAAQLIHEFLPAIHVIIIGSDDTGEMRDTCLDHGADGFVSKRHCDRDLSREISRALVGSSGGMSRV
jgi:CheY-like chemotaxis protein